jgi:alpha-glucuronidase
VRSACGKLAVLIVERIVFRYAAASSSFNRLARHKSLKAALLLFLLAPTLVMAESGAEAWLRYAPLTREQAERYSSVPSTVIVLGDSAVAAASRDEWIRGIHGMLGRSIRAARGLPAEDAIVLGTMAEFRSQNIHLHQPPNLRQDGYWLTRTKLNRHPCLVVAATSDRGVLYGVFALLSKFARLEDVRSLDEIQQPSAPLRWVNQWDNLDGRIERGYAGPSIFFTGGKVREDLRRASEYARLLASVGINGCAVNNVNADPSLLQNDFIPQLARIAEVFRPWGVQLSLSVDLSSPKAIGGLATFDPLDTAVAHWWKQKVDQIYRAIPDLGGFVMKADSEGRPGPANYGRTPADAANVIARALAPHGGVVFYRAFVYDHHLDWRNLKNDRAKAAYDIFHPLDGQFDDNVVVQIKYGPIDFQVREPVSPLFGGLKHTNEAIELQITQEYNGQQRHLCFLAPIWNEILDFDLQVDGRQTPVRDIVAGRAFHRASGGFVGVANVGMDVNWMHHPLALANLYAFGRLAWDPELRAASIIDEWTRLTFGNDPEVVNTVTKMQLSSWSTYESYTGPLGVGTLTNILRSHYGPGPESSEKNGWGQWHRADEKGIGMDRTIATGTGFIGQYSLGVQKLYEDLTDCPDNLLLFFHHVSYAHVLHSGKTVIQSMYDSHYDGAAKAQLYAAKWQKLEPKIDPDRYHDVLARLEYQAGHAIVWRDAICDWLYRLSGIADREGRVGNHPDRIEAEDMELQNYVPVVVAPPEAASRGKAVTCAQAQPCAAAFSFKGLPGQYKIFVQYFDLNRGGARFSVAVNGRPIDEWFADDDLPATKIDTDSSTRRTIRGVTLRPGDEIKIGGMPEGQDPAALDYIEIHADSR